MLVRIEKIILVVLMVAGAAFAGTEITLPKSVEVEPGYVRLGEVAQISGDNQAAMMKVFLGRSPKIGKSSSLGRNWIITRLKATGLYEGVSFSGFERVTLVGVKEGGSANPEVRESKSDKAQKPTSGIAAGSHAEAKYVFKEQPVAVARGAVRSVARAVESDPQALAQKREQINKLLISRAVKIYIAKTLGMKDVESVVMVRGFKFTSDKISSVSVEGLTNGSINGRGQYGLVLSNLNGEIVGFGEADVNSSVSVKVPVVLRSIRKGELVRKGDVEIRKIKYDDKVSLETANVDEFIGRVAVKNLRSGEAVRQSYFDSPLDVLKGKPVTVVASGVGFQIKEMTIALSDGRRGDYIDVKSLIDERVYKVRVSGPGRADNPSGSALY